MRKLFVNPNQTQNPSSYFPKPQNSVASADPIEDDDAPLTEEQKKIIEKNKLAAQEVIRSRILTLAISTKTIGKATPTTRRKSKFYECKFTARPTITKETNCAPCSCNPATITNCNFTLQDSVFSLL